MNQWDKYFLEICNKVADNSKCLSRKVGAILVRDKRVLVHGYNGPPQGVPHCGERYENDDNLKHQIEYLKHLVCEGEISSATTFHPKEGLTLNIINDFSSFKEEVFKPLEELKRQCPRRSLGLKSGTGLEWCIAGHGERNVLCTAARFGISTNEAKLYMNCGVPCTPCLIEIINAGISEIVITKVQYYDLMSEWILKNSKLKYRVYDL